MQRRVFQESQRITAREEALIEREKLLDEREKKIGEKEGKLKELWLKVSYRIKEIKLQTERDREKNINSTRQEQEKQLGLIKREQDRLAIGKESLRIKYQEYIERAKHDLRNEIKALESKIVEYGEILECLASCRSIDALEKYKHLVNQEAIAREKDQLARYNFLQERGYKSEYELHSGTGPNRNIGDLVAFKMGMPNYTLEAREEREKAKKDLMFHLHNPQVPSTWEKKKFRNSLKY